MLHMSQNRNTNKFAHFCRLIDVTFLIKILTFMLVWIKPPIFVLLITTSRSLKQPMHIVVTFM